MDEKALALEVLNRSKALVNSGGRHITLEALPGKARQVNKGDYKVVVTDATHSVDIPENERVNYCFIYRGDDKLFNACWKSAKQLSSYYFLKQDWQNEFLSLR